MSRVGCGCGPAAVVSALAALLVAELVRADVRSSSAVEAQGQASPTRRLILACCCGAWIDQQVSPHVVDNFERAWHQVHRTPSCAALSAEAFIELRGEQSSLLRLRPRMGRALA